MLKVNLGCSDQNMPGFLNVDRWTPPWATAENFLQVDLNVKWPWADGSVDHIRAHHILEHIQNDPMKGLENINWCMGEIYRVLKPGGTIEIVVPTTDGRGAWQDFTHKTFWNRNTFFYFEARNLHYTRFKDAYGTRAAFTVEFERHQKLPDEVVILHIVLAAVKEVALEDQFLQVDSEAIA